MRTFREPQGKKADLDRERESKSNFWQSSMHMSHFPMGEIIVPGVSMVMMGGK